MAWPIGVPVHVQNAASRELGYLPVCSIEIDAGLPVCAPSLADPEQQINCVSFAGDPTNLRAGSVFAMARQAQLNIGDGRVDDGKHLSAERFLSGVPSSIFADAVLCAGKIAAGDCSRYTYSDGSVRIRN